MRRAVSSHHHHPLSSAKPTRQRVSDGEGGSCVCAVCFPFSTASRARATPCAEEGFLLELVPGQEGGSERERESKREMNKSGRQETSEGDVFKHDTHGTCFFIHHDLYESRTEDTRAGEDRERSCVSSCTARNVEMEEKGYSLLEKNIHCVVRQYIEIVKRSAEIQLSMTQ